MANKIGSTKTKAIKIGSTKAKKICIGSTKVWTGATLVSYYDGSNLLGTVEVDEGNDVLHPAITTTKTGYTLVGWAKIKNGAKLSSLAASGEAMSLYALYLPNSLTVLSATLTTPAGQVNPSYEVNNYDTNYVASPTHAVATGWYNGAWTTEDTQSMYVNIGLYKTMTVKGHGRGWGDNLVTTIDGTNCVDSTITKTYSTSRTITMYAKGTHTDPGSWHVVRCGVTSIVLSNPIAWT